MDVLGIDIGGTTVKGSRVSRDGTVLAAARRDTPTDGDVLLAAVVDMATELRTASTGALGVACPGVLEDGVVRYAANLPWRDRPVRAELEEALNLPVVLERDVAAAAVAESAHLAHEDALFVWLGTGVASAHVIAGRLCPGGTGRAGELGHVPVRPDGETCACGQRGCVEVYASAAGLSRRYEQNTGTALSGEAVVSRVGTDPAAAAVWDDAVEALTLALVTCTLISDPAVIVIGGGLSGAGETLLDPVRRALAGRLAWRPPPPVIAAALGESAGQLGAAYRAWDIAPSRSVAREQEGARS